MIRQLTEEDRQQTMAFVSNKPAENLFIIGDIEGYGFDSAIQKVWGDFDDTGKLRGVLLKYDQNYIPYAPAEYDAQGFAEIMNGDQDFTYLSGIEEIVEKLSPFLTKTPESPRVMYYAKCENAEKMPDVPEQLDIIRAVPDDAVRITDLMKSIPEFEGGNYNADHKRQSLEKGFARCYYIEENGQMVSSASSTAENSQSAMIVGVGTLPGYQKKGYASYCMSVICSKLLEEGKMLCLFYDNPAAGNIYKRIGFVDIGKWCMWKF
ncbi:GNAT family N-acetyltransferase [Chungangia koreensis]|uniref:GNAT family N-acetyltransferase n=1 Tax=Chungangia koreensis TaxID=752657 RepID=A0ABV8X5S3_9LACT